MLPWISIFRELNKFKVHWMTEPAMCAHKKNTRSTPSAIGIGCFTCAKHILPIRYTYEHAMCAHKTKHRIQTVRIRHRVFFLCKTCSSNSLHLRHYFQSRTKSSATTTVISSDNSHGLRILDTPILFVVLGPSKIRSSAFAFVLCSASPFCISHSWGTGKLDTCILFCP